MTVAESESEAFVFVDLPGYIRVDYIAWKWVSLIATHELITDIDLNRGEVRCAKCKRAKEEVDGEKVSR